MWLRIRSANRREFERSLVNALLSGEAGAASRFLDYTSATLWSIVAKLEGDGADGEAAFLHVVTSLEADGYARLKGFDGRARLSTYLSLVARDILGDRLARRFGETRFGETPHDAWNRFVRFFERDIRSRVARQLPRNVGNAAREHAYQEICLKLIENDFHRIRAYGGRGNFTGYVLTVVDRILIDLIRRDVLVEDGGGLSLADLAPTPKDYMLLAEGERSRAALVAAVKAAAADLPTDERLYLQIVFGAGGPLPARDIAKLMGYRVEEVHRLKQRTRKWLRGMAMQFDKNSNMA
jgi:RNA polymerase sigma factor (sigma-70 family)